MLKHQQCGVDGKAELAGDLVGESRLLETLWLQSSIKKGTNKAEEEAEGSAELGFARNRRDCQAGQAPISVSST